MKHLADEESFQIAPRSPQDAVARILQIQKHVKPDPEGWTRFERAVDAALHTPAKHKPKAKGESSPPTKGRSKTA